MTRRVFNLLRAAVANDGCLVVLLFLSALIPRVGLAIKLDRGRHVYTDPFYEIYARNFHAGRGLVAEYSYEGTGETIPLRSFRPPLFPLLWGLVYGVTGGKYLPIRLAHAALSALTCVLAFFIGKRLVSREAAALGAFLVGWYPPLVWHGVNLMTEPLFMFSLVLTVLLLLEARERGRGMLWALAAGVCAGLGTLSRSVLQGFVPLAGLWLIFSPTNRRRGLAMALAFWLGFALVMTPWIVRNWRVHHAFVPTTTDAGHGFFIGNNERTLTDPRGVYMPERWEFLKGLSEVQIDRKLYSLGLQFIREHPGRWCRHLLDKFLRFWRFYPHGEFVATDQFSSNVLSTQLYVHVYGLSYTLAFLFIVPGFVLAHLRLPAQRPAYHLLLVLTAYMTGIHMLYIAVLRYREPLMFFFLSFAGYGFLRAWGALRGRTQVGPEGPGHGGGKTDGFPSAPGPM